MQHQTFKKKNTTIFFIFDASSNIYVVNLCGFSQYRSLVQVSKSILLQIKLSTGLRLSLFVTDRSSGCWCLLLLNVPRYCTRMGQWYLNPRRTKAADNSGKFPIMLCFGLRVFLCVMGTVAPRAESHELCK